MTKGRPIIFSTDMVKAILEGRKTQTRRVIKLDKNGLYCCPPVKASLNPKTWEKEVIEAECPYGKVGDKLWVRETWRIDSFMEGDPLKFGYKDNQSMEEYDGDLIGTINYEEWYERITIQSTEDAEKAFKKGLITQDEEGYYRWDNKESPCRWRPSIYMPRWASRITLEITDIRVERLQEISEEDAKADSGKEKCCEAKGHGAIEAFKGLWNSINDQRKQPTYEMFKYRWEDNPWVWVITFKVIK